MEREKWREMGEERNGSNIVLQNHQKGAQNPKLTTPFPFLFLQVSTQVSIPAQGLGSTFSPFFLSYHSSLPLCVVSLSVLNGDRKEMTMHDALCMGRGELACRAEGER